MSDSLDTDPIPSAREALDALHHSIITRTDLDTRYVNPLTNLQKVTFICEVLGEAVTRETIDLTAGYNFHDWIHSGNRSLLIAGIFLTDLQEEYWSKVIADAPAKAAYIDWENHAEAEWWHQLFSRTSHYLQTGNRVDEQRVLH